MKLAMNSLALLFVLLFAQAIPLTTHGEDQKMQLGMYVAVSDLGAAKTFYTKLFNLEPVTQTDTFVGFELEGGRFGLLQQAMYAAPLVRGNNAVVNIRVDDIDAEYARVKTLDPSLIQDQIVSAGMMRLFMFKDPDGNVVEFFSFNP